jgi:hypothetical protein
MAKTRMMRIHPGASVSRNGIVGHLQNRLEDELLGKDKQDLLKQDIFGQELIRFTL